MDSESEKLIITMNNLKQNDFKNIGAVSLFLGLFLFLFSSIIHAAAYQSHSSIYNAAKSFVNNNILTQYDNQASVVVSKLDSRLKLKKCNRRLESHLAKGRREIGRTTVTVKCKGVKPWSLQIPVTISVFGDVMVAKKQLVKGRVLAQTDIKMEKRDLAGLPHGYIDEMTSSIGLKIKRRVTAGTVLTPSMLKKPRIVNRGQKITIWASTGRMQVRMEGKALAHGAAGDRIRVMNLKSQKKLEGVITQKGEVKIDI